MKTVRGGLMKGILTAVLLAAAAAAPAGMFAADGGKTDKAKGEIVAGYRGTPITLGWDQLLYVKKGDRVDVMVTFEAIMKDDRKEKVTATILQNVVVVNVMKPAGREGVGVIELLLNPNEAQYAALSAAQGKVHISVRAPGDLELHPMEMASFRRLIK